MQMLVDCKLLTDERYEQYNKDARMLCDLILKMAIDYAEERNIDQKLWLSVFYNQMKLQMIVADSSDYKIEVMNDEKH
jgi:hypothetical protein